ncbi:polysaccharide biosynthesis C-terminal domain-containing protein [Anaerobacillus sp. HL2]|nr:polysaccharide biosynthesis C-terminal domain-containing protein [Anaerobacillus sp. HL2]
MLIISFSALFTSLAVLTTGILQGMNRSNTAAVIVVISAVLKIIFNIIFVGIYGLLGAAISTLLTYIILTVLNYWMIYKKPCRLVINREITVWIFSLVMGELIISIYVFNVENWTRLEALLYVYHDWTLEQLYTDYRFTVKRIIKRRSCNVFH